MVEITINPPSEEIMKAANATAVVKDSLGRQIAIKKMNALERMWLFEAVGPDNIANEAYFGYASLAYHVISIDGEPIPKPRSKPQLEALVQRLDDEGMVAIAAGVAENFIVAPEADQKDAVKNV